MKDIFKIFTIDYKLMLYVQYCLFYKILLIAIDV